MRKIIVAMLVAIVFAGCGGNDIEEDGGKIQKKIDFEAETPRDEFEQKIINLINTYRKEVEAPPVQYSPRIDVLTEDYFSHHSETLKTEDVDTGHDDYFLSRARELGIGLTKDVIVTTQFIDTSKGTKIYENKLNSEIKDFVVDPNFFQPNKNMVCGVSKIMNYDYTDPNTYNKFNYDTFFVLCGTFKDIR